MQRDALAAVFWKFRVCAKIRALDLLPVWAGGRIDADEQEVGEVSLKNHLTEPAGIQQKR